VEYVLLFPGRRIAMIRIFTSDTTNGVNITIDGQLIDDGVDEVECCAKQAMTEGRQVGLFLRDVTEIDGRGRSLLTRLATKGVRLSASGVYSSYIVSEIQGFGT
jgi:hypothetical protein